MLDYKHILYAVELDNDLEKNIKKIFSAAAKSKTKITLVHYVKSITAAYAGAAVYVAFENPEDEIVKQAKDKLSDLVKQYKLVNIDLIVTVVNDIRSAILNKSKELKVDAIYLNGHKHNAFGRLGSTADCIINNAKCDVVILK